MSVFKIILIIQLNDTTKTRVIDLTVEQMGFSKKGSKKYIFMKSIRSVFNCIKHV